MTDMKKCSKLLSMEVKPQLIDKCAVKIHFMFKFGNKKTFHLHFNTYTVIVNKRQWKSHHSWQTTKKGRNCE